MRILRIISSLLFAFTLLLWNGCKSDLEDSLPKNIISGDYQYSSTVQYFDVNGSKTETKTIQGGMSFSNNVQNEFYITPLRGWSYTLNGTNFKNHVLSTGAVVQSFRLPLQSVNVNQKDFNVSGSELIVLLDPDGTVIGKYDGLIDKNEIKISFYSYDLVSGEKVSTLINAVKL